MSSVLENGGGRDPPKTKPIYSNKDEAVLRRLDMENHKQKELEGVLVKSLNASRRDVMVQSLALAVIDVFLRNGLPETLEAVMQGFSSFIKVDDNRGVSPSSFLATA